MNIPSGYRQEYMNGLWNKVKFWWLLKKVRAAKVKQLWEGNIDRYYIEKNFNDQLLFDEEKDRNIIEAERRKPLAQQDKAKLEEAEERIERAKAIRKVYRHTRAMMEDVRIYLETIKDFYKDENPKV